MAKGYTDRKRFTEKQIQARVYKMEHKKLDALVVSLVDALYGQTADENWGADMLDSIAQLLHSYKLTP